MRQYVSGNACGLQDDFVKNSLNLLSNRRFTAALGAAALAFLRDHSVSGRALCPAAAFLEAAIVSGSMLKEDGAGNSLLLRGVIFSKALLLNR